MLIVGLDARQILEIPSVDVAEEDVVARIVALPIFPQRCGTLIYPIAPAWRGSAAGNFVGTSMCPVSANARNRAFAPITPVSG